MLVIRTFTARRDAPQEFPSAAARRRATATPLAVVTITTALMAAVAGCGGGGSPSTAGGSPAATVAGAGGGTAQTRQVLEQYAHCVRSHGFPTFPDPRLDANGQITFPGNNEQIKRAGLQTQQACGSILNQLPARVTHLTGPVSPAQLAAERQWAACMRQHGLPDWPDPQADGSFRLSTTPYATMGKTGPVGVGLRACQRYQTFGGIRLS